MYFLSPKKFNNHFMKKLVPLSDAEKALVQRTIVKSKSGIEIVEYPEGYVLKCVGITTRGRVAKELFKVV